MRFVLLLLICFISTASSAEGTVQQHALVSTKRPGFLPPENVFYFDAAVRDARTLQIIFNVAPGYYLYRNRISFSVKDDTAKITAVGFPKGEMKHDPNFGDMEVFHHPFQVEITLDRAHTEATSITLNTEVAPQNWTVL